MQKSKSKPIADRGYRRYRVRRDEEVANNSGVKYWCLYICINWVYNDIHEYNSEFIILIIKRIWKYYKPGAAGALTTASASV